MTKRSHSRVKEREEPLNVLQLLVSRVIGN
jgi:hypothetical protein